MTTAAWFPEWGEVGSVNALRMVNGSGGSLEAMVDTEGVNGGHTGGSVRVDSYITACMCLVRKEESDRVESINRPGGLAI
jgi:hypothetical protein